MRFSISAGHNPSGKIACGASDLLDESNQSRKVCKYLIKLLKRKGHKVYNCTVNNGTSQLDVLRKIVAKCNAHDVDLDISIHFNSGRSDKKGDGKSGGCEVLLTEKKGFKGSVATEICREIEKLGYTNRGVKERNNLYFLNKTKAPAILVECCFVDDMDDYKIYKQGNYKAMAKAIFDGITVANLISIN